MKVLVTKEKLDSLAATISVKAGASLPLSIDEMASAVQSIQNTSTPSLQAKTAIPSSAQFTVTADSGYDGLSSVTVAAITPTYIGTGIATRSANNVAISGRNVTVSSGYYPNNVSKTVTTATYSIQYDQTFDSNNTKVNTVYSVNDFQQGYITTLAITPAEQTVISQTFTPSTVTQTYTQNDAGSFLRTVTVEPIPNTGIEIPSTTAQTQINTKTKTLTTSAASIQFTGLEGEPSSFVVISSTNQTTGGTKVASVAYDGFSLYGMDITTQAQNDDNFTYSYSNGTLTITASSASFQANEYKLVYSYGGTPENDVDTKDVQVGSGATSITFTGLKGEPSYFSCVFKSNFSTSSGYQRVISVVYDGTSTYGLAMGSGAIAASSWTYTYNNSTLTITSQGTNNGGYFHQPGYYQLTYAMGASGKGQSMKVTPSTSEQLVYADEGHTLDMVLVEAIPTAYIIPTGTMTITNNGNYNVTNTASVSVSVSGTGATYITPNYNKFTLDFIEEMPISTYFNWAGNDNWHDAIGTSILLFTDKENEEIIPVLGKSDTGIENCSIIEGIIPFSETLFFNHTQGTNNAIYSISGTIVNLRRQPLWYQLVIQDDTYGAYYVCKRWYDSSDNWQLGDNITIYFDSQGGMYPYNETQYEWNNNLISLPDKISFIEGMEADYAFQTNDYNFIGQSINHNNFSVNDIISIIFPFEKIITIGY